MVWNTHTYEFSSAMLDYSFYHGEREVEEQNLPTGNILCNKIPHLLMNFNHKATSAFDRIRSF